MANTKMTKKDYFNQLFEVVNESKAENKDDLLDFINHELELINRRNNSSNRHQTTTQTANLAIMETIKQTLAEFESPVTITELQNSCTDLSGLTNQKITSLLHKLIADGKVTRTMDKKKAYFSITKIE